jgi:hypothetical protein
MRIGTHTHVERFNFFIEERQLAFLRDESARTGLPVSALLRRAIDKTYRPHFRPRVGGFEVSFGIWPRPDAAVAGRRPRPY